jgi:hypothetical protein
VPAGLVRELVAGVVAGGLIGDVQDDRADPGVGGGERLEGICSAGGGEHDVAGVAEADDGGLTDPSRGAGHQDLSHVGWGCWPGGHGRGLGGHGVSLRGW